MTAERWRHIVNRHSEMEAHRDKVLETVAFPDTVLEGDFGTLIAAKHYEHTPLTEKWVIAAYREVGENDGFILTAYFATELSRRRQVLWKR